MDIFLNKKINAGHVLNNRATNKYKQLNFNLKNIIFDYSPFFQHIEQNLLIDKSSFKASLNRTIISLYKNTHREIEHQITLNTSDIEKIKNNFFSEALENGLVSESQILKMFAFILKEKYKHIKNIFIVKGYRQRYRREIHEFDQNINAEENWIDSISYRHNDFNTSSLKFFSYRISIECLIEFIREINFKNKNKKMIGISSVKFKGTNNLSYIINSHTQMEDSLKTLNYVITEMNLNRNIKFLELFIDSENMPLKIYPQRTRINGLILPTSHAERFNKVLHYDLTQFSYHYYFGFKDIQIDFSKFFKKLKSNNLVKELHLKNINLGKNSEDIISFSNFLEKTESLEKLDISYNCIGASNYRDISKFFSALEKNQSLQELNMHENDYGLITDNLFYTIFNSLGKNKSLKALDISTSYLVFNLKNQIEISFSAEEDFEISLEKLNISYLNHSEINKNLFLDVFCGILPHCGKLKSLKMNIDLPRANHVTKKFEKFCEYIKSNKTLTELQMMILVGKASVNEIWDLLAEAMNNPELIDICIYLDQESEYVKYLLNKLDGRELILKELKSYFWDFKGLKSIQ